MPVILLVAAVALRDIDSFPPTIDEFSSLQNAGWLVDWAYSPGEVIRSLKENTPDHTPAYFIVLAIWGNFVPDDIAMANVLNVFTALLALAVVWRLAYDFVSPVAALAALALLASNAYFDWHIIHGRMYPMIVLFAAIALWLYFRIMSRSRGPTTVDYILFFASVFIFINLHFFNLIYVAAFGAFHLAFAAKNRRWVLCTFAVLAAFALFAPYAYEARDLLGAAQAARVDPDRQLDALGLISLWLDVISNEYPLVLLIPLAGFLSALRKGNRKLVWWMILIALSLLALALVAQFTTLITERTMRYHLAALPVAAIATVAGVVALRRHALWLMIFTVICCFAGVRWHRSADWRALLGDRYAITLGPPTQTISRLALEASPEPSLVVYFAEWDYIRRLDYGADNPFLNFELTQAEYFFAQHGIQIMDLYEVSDAHINQLDPARPLWFVYRRSQLTADAQHQFDAIVDAAHLKTCDTVSIPNDSVIVRLVGQDRACES